MSMSSVATSNARGVTAATRSSHGRAAHGFMRGGNESMSRIGDAEVFVAVVDSGGFTAAARELGLSQPAVSRRVTGLEARLGVRLLARSTRQIRPTDAGRSFYERCRRAL